MAGQESATVDELVQVAGMSRQACLHLRDAAPPPALEDYARTLLANGFGEDALRLVARSLPRKFALAWACDNVKRALRPASEDFERDRAGAALAEGWLASPNERQRRLALEFAERNGFAGTGSWLAAAAGWMEGSLAPEGYAEIPPPPHLVYDAVIAAQLTLVAADAATMPELLQRFVASALPGSGMEQ